MEGEEFEAPSRQDALEYAQDRSNEEGREFWVVSERGNPVVKIAKVAPHRR
jgi:hypothetical protein